MAAVVSRRPTSYAKCNTDLKRLLVIMLSLVRDHVISTRVISVHGLPAYYSGPSANRKLLLYPRRDTDLIPGVREPLVWLLRGSLNILRHYFFNTLPIVFLIRCRKLALKSPEAYKPPGIYS